MPKMRGVKRRAIGRKQLRHFGSTKGLEAF